MDNPNGSVGLNFYTEVNSETEVNRETEVADVQNASGAPDIADDRNSEANSIIVCYDENSTGGIDFDTLTGSDRDDQKKPGKFFLSGYDEDASTQRKRNNDAKREHRKEIEILRLMQNEDLIDRLIQNMNNAYLQDLELYRERKLATRKLAMLNEVISQLRKKHFQQTFIENKILNVLANWLTPLPKNGLPNYMIRDGILRVLEDFPPIDKNFLKESGIGKAIMYLKIHPEETKTNRERAQLIIDRWARQIHNISDDYRTMSKEERRKRDLERKRKLDQARKLVRQSAQPRTTSPAKESESAGAIIIASNDDKNDRARVPMTSTTDYIMRPKSTVEFTSQKPKKRKLTRLEVTQKRFKSTQPSTKTFKGNVSVYGDKM